MQHKTLDSAQLLDLNFITSAVDILTSTDEKIAFELSLLLLDINSDAYANIHSVEFKKDFLRYKFLCAEFKSCEPKYSSVESQLHLVYELAYEKLLNSSLTNESTTPYSPLSYGLSEFDLRTVKKAPEKSPEQTAEILEQSMHRIGAKKHGVEPGFEAIHAKDILLYLFKKYPQKETRVAVIKSCGADILNLYEQLKEILPKYLVKLDYKEVKDERVVVDKEDLKRTKTIKYFYNKGIIIGDIVSWIYQQVKSVPSAEKNVEAVLEVLANDVARLFMSVQQQTLYEARFDNGLLKLMLKAEWIEGATTLDPIAGGDHDDQYCVKPFERSASGIAYVSDQSIRHLAAMLLILIVQNDRDAIGSQGQNKLRKDNEFFGIDFGHAYQSTILLVDSLTDDFHIKDANFKNYSVFYDAPRSEIIRGLIKLAALAGRKPDKSILESYGEDFVAEIEAVVPHSDERIFDDYILKFYELMHKFEQGDDAPEIKKANIDCCMMIIKSVNTAKERHVLARDQLISRFAYYLNLRADAVNLLENFEKLCTPLNKISLRSPDRTVLLRHLRVDDDRRAKWTVIVGDDGQHVLVGSFQSGQLAKDALQAIQSMLPSKTDETISIHRTKRNVAISFNKKYLPYLCNIFHEHKIMKKYCKKDFDLLMSYDAEVQHSLENKLESIHKSIESFNAANPFLSLALNLDQDGFSLQLIEKNNGYLGSGRFVKLFAKNLQEKFDFDPQHASFFVSETKLDALAQFLPIVCDRFKMLPRVLLSAPRANSVFEERAGLVPPQSSETHALSVSFALRKDS